MLPQLNDDVNMAKEEMTSQTYEVDFKNQRIKGKIDGIEALKQSIYFILNTIRYRNTIYSQNYGNEIEKAIGLDFDLAKTELKRYIEEAILEDRRVLEIQNYVAKKIDAGGFEVSFDVKTIFGKQINIKKKVGE